MRAWRSEVHTFGSSSPSYPLAQSPSSLPLSGPHPAFALDFTPPPSFLGVSLLARFMAFAGASTASSPAAARFLPEASLAAFALGDISATASTEGNGVPAMRALFLLPEFGAEDFAAAPGAPAAAVFLGLDFGEATDPGGAFATPFVFISDLLLTDVFSAMDRPSPKDPLCPLPRIGITNRPNDEVRAKAQEKKDIR